ncbi:transmembrane 4 L6 family member 5 [Microcaecilia unicolor]|uniref:Transmembrane 4 L6 family member 5-like n=1 Tax=Microcaecilia unicolor TaxID=1415580 RepID=A0A6P7WUL0_9AMPH|nr:transmembrane 4 L6 family member 5-like [Microcaecilia unicolor]
MCTGKCAKFIGASLYPLILFNIVCNVVLFFPNWKTEYIKEPDMFITPEVVYLGGLIGGGILILIPAIHIQATGRKGCCANRCGMFLSIAFAAVGVAGSVYSTVVAILGLVHGPKCLAKNPVTGMLNANWTSPFKEELEKFNNESYLFNKDMWSICVEPEGVVEFNIILFSIILASSLIQVVLCLIQMINGLFGCLCGTCRKDKSEPAYR